MMTKNQRMLLTVYWGIVFVVINGMFICGVYLDKKISVEAVPMIMMGMVSGLFLVRSVLRLRKYK